MSRRKLSFQNENFYHIYNRALDFKPIFQKRKAACRFISLLGLYCFADFSISYSRFARYSRREKEKIIKKLKNNNKLLAELIVFCVMPNHFHLLLKQKQSGGISKFIGNLQNSYAKYFNTREKRAGSLFEGQFKGVLVESEEQLIHLSRYIHLNPYSSGIVSDFKQLHIYPYSSLSEYLDSREGICKTKVIKEIFSTQERYKDFVFNQAEYQKSLQQIKHLQLEPRLPS